MPITSCPQCGEVEKLRGSAAGAGDETAIFVECLTCGHRWERGALRCRSCGGAAVVELPQRMTRHPRGTLLAVTGLRRVPLCPTCDREVVAEVERHRRTVPEGYVSRFVYGAEAGREERSPAVAPMARRRPRGRPRGGAVVALPGVSQSSQPSGPSEPSGVGADPTVRQAVEHFLEHGAGEVQTVALVLWGHEVGATTRLSALDDDAAARELARWVLRVRGHQPPPQREAAAATLCAAVDHWRARGWLAQDLAAGLR